MNYFAAGWEKFYRDSAREAWTREEWASPVEKFYKDDARKALAREVWAGPVEKFYKDYATEMWASEIWADQVEKFYKDYATEMWASEIWADQVEKEKKSFESFYRNGWTKSLNSQSQEKLSWMATTHNQQLEVLDRLNPAYIQRILQAAALEDELNTSQLYQLDGCIIDIFLHHKRPLHSLEKERDREQAAMESIVEKDSLSFDVLKILLEATLAKIELTEEDF